MQKISSKITRSDRDSSITAALDSCSLLRLHLQSSFFADSEILTPSSIFSASPPFREKVSARSDLGLFVYKMGAMKAAIGDAFITFVWMMCISTAGAFTTIVSSAFNLHGVVASLGITTLFIAITVFVFNIISEVLGGASFNPTGNAAFYAAGISSDSLFSMALRFPAQAAGAVGGALAIAELMPSQYKHTLIGPSVKVDLHTGAIAEGVLTFLITLAVLCIMIKGPGGSVIKTLTLSVATVALIVAGSGYTGPSMNPVNAYGWAYIDNRHNTWEQFYVYWICPFIGAILAAWVFRFLFPPPSPESKKEKKA
ncbi:aquaporin SIP1-2-like [Phalaenopsis equestris]|uniref:aquaporin SIP1-2-like n=1 Tax=Phalaenopsis equestris TaxID=78828 RepID=UPI0009E241DF|nr:aquaporin SIP1-2-like [Phalaenopsis equestris]